MVGSYSDFYQKIVKKNPELLTARLVIQAAEWASMNLNCLISPPVFFERGHEPDKYEQHCLAEQFAAEALGYA